MFSDEQSSLLGLLARLVSPLGAVERRGLFDDEDDPCFFPSLPEWCMAREKMIVKCLLVE